MALDESIEGLEKVVSNSISAYMEPKLKDYLKQYGTITIDFMSNPYGSGYQIIVGSNSCSDGNCGGSC